MACFSREKSFVHEQLRAIVNGRKTVVNVSLEVTARVRDSKNLRDKVRPEIAAFPDDGAFFHNTDEVIALGVVVMKIAIHFFSTR